MEYVVMRQADVDTWTYAEMDGYGDVPGYPTRAAAEARTAELGGRANGYSAYGEWDAGTLYQLGSVPGRSAAHLPLAAALAPDEVPSWP